MSLVVYAESSAGTYPGQMVAGEENAEGGVRYFGFRFDPADLPEPFRDQKRWRDYLLVHAVPGQIVDETDYVARLLLAADGDYFEKRADCEIPIETQLPARENWRPHAWCSFNPDDPHLDHQPCYNCDTWAIMIANKLVEGFLPQVHQGRLMSILKHMNRRGE
jgi:hypothetical protein